MPLSLAELFRALTSFSARRVDTRGADWETFSEWSLENGLAPLVAYNLEYRMAGGGAPEWARERLLSIYQGSANDNVMKLVNFKRAVDDLEGRTIVLLGAASYAESVYPHVAFRPVTDITMLVPPKDLGPLSAYLRKAEFKPARAEESMLKGDLLLSDTRTLLALFGSLTPSPEEDAALLKRAVPMKVYGASIFRLDLEDALLGEARILALNGFNVPLIHAIDLRELATGSQSMGGIYSRPVDAPVLKTRAKVWKCERSLWTALSLVKAIFPEAKVDALLPELPVDVQRQLAEAFVTPLATIGRPGPLNADARALSLLNDG